MKVTKFGGSVQSVLVAVLSPAVFSEYQHKVADPETDVLMQIFYPSAAYITQYLSEARQYFLQTLTEKNLDTRKEFLASAYQLAISSQAFETVWNSVVMGLVNFILEKKLSKARMAHGSLDALAFVLSKKSFAHYFGTFIEYFSTNIEDKNILSE